MFQSICLGADQDHRNSKLLQVLLRCEFPVDSDKHIEFLFGQLKQFAVLDSTPAMFRNSSYSMADE